MAELTNETWKYMEMSVFSFKHRGFPAILNEGMMGMGLQ